MEVHDLVLRLSERLGRPLPGEDAQFRMAPHYRVRGGFAHIDETEYRHSAVMALFCERSPGQLFIPLILRTDYDGHHSAQVSLPGGRFEEDDGTLANTAVRECAEEIGLAEPVHILGSLTQLHIPVSRYIVHPFVGVYGGRVELYRTQEREVRAVIEVSLGELMNDSCLASGIFKSSSGTVQAPCFEFGGHHVWGATAMILSELKQVIEEAI